MLGIGWEIGVADMVELLDSLCGLGEQIAIFAAHFRNEGSCSEEEGFDFRLDLDFGSLLLCLPDLCL